MIFPFDQLFQRAAASTTRASRLDPLLAGLGEISMRPLRHFKARA